MPIPHRTPVLIVGGGPCGLMLSIELGRRGTASTLIDGKARTARNPQANATQARTMEYFRRLGFAEEIRALGLPKDYPTDIAYFTRYASWELARFRLPPSSQASAVVRDPASGWSSAELPHRVSQKFVEEVLLRHAEAEPVSSINYGWRLTGFDEAPEGIEAALENVESGETRTVLADYLIGADGAKSLVRRELGIGYAGETGVARDFFGGKMVALYIRSPDLYRVIPHDPAWMYWAFNPQRRSWLAAVNGKDEFAFHTQLRPGESEEISEARARELFGQAMGVDVDIELIDIDTWTAGHALVAESFGRSRVFIAGDAAHLFTPAGGLGYNTAVEDAVNLGWKLAAAVKGTAGDGLLESYAAERHRLGVRNTGYARQLAESIGNFVPQPGIEDPGEQGAAIRAQAGEYLDGHARREFSIPGITFGSRYDGSGIIIPDGTEPPPDTANRYVPSATPGGRTPHFWLADGRSLFDAFGFDWSLLVVDPAGLDGVASFVEAAKGAGLDLAVVDITGEWVRDLFEADLVLVRPDQIVAWRGAGRGLDCEQIFRRVMGFGSPRRSSGPVSAQADRCRI